MIRFACPSCHSVLACGVERAGKTVTCPKCRQRMRVPQNVGRGEAPKTFVSTKTFVAVVVLLLAGIAGGTWLLMRSLGRKSPPAVAVNVQVPEPAEAKQPTKEKPATPPPVKPEKDKSPSDDTPTPQPPAKKESSPPPPPLPTSPKEKPKVIALTDDLPPELIFDVVDAVNSHRRKAELTPIFVDAPASRLCQTRADSLARRAMPSTEGEATFEAVSEPLTALETWLKEPARRTAILEPRLRTFGVGFARNTKGEWFSVFDWDSGLDRDPPSSSSITPIDDGNKGDAVAVYPVPGQMRVPLWFPGNETPDPLPKVKNKLAGYPITLLFPLQVRVSDATAHLSDKDENSIDVWLSSPEKPANDKFADSQNNTICIIAKKPLKPNTRYGVEVTARVNAAPWSAKWTFTTLTEGELQQEMAGRLLRTFNAVRRRAGLPPVPLDVESSQACAAHAHYLGVNAPVDPALNWNEEKADRPSYSEAGAEVARRAAIQGGGGPIEAVNGLVDSLISRPQLLDPRLRSLGLGYTPFAHGGWIWVLDMRRGRENDGSHPIFLYPAPNQQEIPLVYPAGEVPSPIPPESKDRVAGYAITADFAYRTSVKNAKAKLTDDKGALLSGWFSTPEKPAIDDFPQQSLCFLARTPLRPNTRYTMTFAAEVDGKAWQRTWSFTTVARPDRFSADFDAQIVAQVNGVRKIAGLPAVRLDAQLSNGCQAHARYLSLNEKRPEVRGIAVHRENDRLPGATPQGARAAEKSVIAIVLDPNSCLDGWMATLYHRIPLLAANLQRVGFGHAPMSDGKWACVLDTGNGRTP